MTAQLYIADIRPLAGREAALLPLLSRERRQQAEALRSPEGRLHCIAAGLLLRRVLGVGDGDVTVNCHGKPALTHRDDLHFSLSHGGDYVVLAVAPQPLGVDIQPILPQPRTFPVKKVFHDDEQQWLAADPTPERLTLLWTRLESTLKASGTGFDCPERQYSLTAADCPYHFQTLHHEGSSITLAAEEAFAVERYILPLET